MRILIVTEVFLPKVDGITNRLSHTIRELRDAGHEVLVIAPTTSLPNYYGVEVVRIASRPFPPYPESRMTWPSPRILTRIRRFKPDVVHVVGPACLGYFAAVATRLLRVPLVASYQTDLAAYIRLYNYNWLTPIYWPIMRFFHNLARVNLCPSQHARKELITQGIRNVGLWRGGVDVQRFDPAKRCSAIREDMSQGHPDDPLAVFVGRVSVEKGVESLEPVLQRFPRLRLAIVGDGPLRRELEEKFRHDNVHFMGYRRGEELARVYASADFFLMPSQTETLGFVTLEAMASGLTVIAASAGGTTELVDHGRNGLLYDPDQPEQLLQAVERVLRDQVLRRKLARDAREFAERSNWKAETERLLAKYEEAIMSRRPRAGCARADCGST